MIEFDKFMGELFSLNESGDPDKAFRHLNKILDFEETDKEGRVVNFDYIKEKYKNYLDWWNSMYGERDAQYIAKEERRKDLGDWLAFRLDRNAYNIPRKGRDSYLFGDLTKKQLETSLSKFIETI